MISPMTPLVFLSKDEQGAWDRFAAAAMAGAEVDPMNGYIGEMGSKRAEDFADRMIDARRRRFAGKHGLEAVRTKEVIALRAIASLVQRMLALEEDYDAPKLSAALDRLTEARR